jgi:beta-phosphoglucomutase-like phosphatase (HAD superfamily)
LVVEDSAGGCAAARAAGLRVLGVATSMPLEDLKEHATYAVRRLDEVDMGELARWLGVRGGDKETRRQGDKETGGRG